MACITLDERNANDWSKRGYIFNRLERYNDALKL